MARFADTPAQRGLSVANRTNRRDSETCDARRGLLAAAHRRPKVTMTDVASAVIAPLACNQFATVSVVYPSASGPFSSVRAEGGNLLPAALARDCRFMQKRKIALCAFSFLLGNR
jgi:hypothetical protein